MANVFFREGRRRLLDRAHATTIDPITHTIKSMLVKDTFPAAATLTFVGDASGPTAHEISATGYAGGFSGAGRKTLGNKSWSTNAGQDRVQLNADDVVWTGLGGALNDTIGGSVTYRHNTAEGDSPVIGWYDTNNLTTNGSDVTLDFSATDGLFYF